MSLRTAMKNFQKGKYIHAMYVSVNYNVSFAENKFLILWEEEESVTVVDGDDVQCSVKAIGNECSVLMNGVVYKGKIAAKGNWCYVRHVIWFVWVQYE